MRNLDLEYRVAELERLLHNLIRIGTVAEADYTAALVRVRSGDLLTGWRPWLTQRAMSDRSWWAPRVGEQVVLLSPSGDPAQGVVLPALGQSAAAAPADNPNIRRDVYPDGAVIEYDCEAHRLHALVPGDAALEVSRDATVQAGRKVSADAGERVDITAPQILLSGSIILDGPVIQGGGANGGNAVLNGALHVVRDVTSDADVVGSGISLVSHVHPETGHTTQQPE